MVILLEGRHIRVVVIDFILLPTVTLTILLFLLFLLLMLLKLQYLVFCLIVMQKAGVVEMYLVESQLGDTEVAVVPRRCRYNVAGLDHVGL